MVITPHLIVGAAIGAKTQNLGLIVILGLLSHLIMDRLPHWDYGEKIEKIPRDKYFKKKLFREFLRMGIDGIIGASVVSLIIWQKNMIKPEQLIYILVGVIISLLPDFILGNVKLFYNQLKPLSQKYVNLHNKIFHYPKDIKKPTLLSLGTEILTIIIAIIILVV